MQTRKVKVCLVGAWGVLDMSGTVYALPALTVGFGSKLVPWGLFLCLAVALVAVALDESTPSMVII